MLILGIIIGYVICGIIVLVCNSIDIDEDIKDIILGWWLIPIIILIKYLTNNRKCSIIKKKEKEKLI